MTLQDFAVIFGLIVKLFGAYFIFMGIFALLPEKKKAEQMPHTRFAILLPARNEEGVIGETVATLMMQDYPGELFDIFVIPNNCTDRTESAARAAGARIIHCCDEVSCKGDALHQAMNRLMGQGYDAFCVFDADNQVDPQFLRHMNNAFQNGALVAKGRNEAANPYSSWISGCYALYFTTYNLFYNQARANLGLSAKLVGTGFAVSAELLRQWGGWNTKTIAEDAEFAAICAQHGVRIHWVPEAVTYDEQPNSFRVSMVQRRRWCSGVVQVARGKLPTLFSQGFHILRLDLAIFLISSFVCVLALLSQVVTLLSFGPSSMAIWYIVSYLSMTLGAGALALLSERRSPQIIKSVLLFPVFTLTWTPLQVLAVFRKTSKWEHITHHGTVNLLPHRAA